MLAGPLRSCQATDELDGRLRLALPSRGLDRAAQNRRMSKDYERLCASAEAFVYAAMIRLMVRRLARG